MFGIVVKLQPWLGNLQQSLKLMVTFAIIFKRVASLILNYPEFTHRYCIPPAFGQVVQSLAKRTGFCKNGVDAPCYCVAIQVQSVSEMCWRMRFSRITTERNNFWSKSDEVFPKACTVPHAFRSSSNVKFAILTILQK